MAKFINLNNDFQIDRVAKPDEVSDKEITLNWIENVMVMGYESGLNEDKRRIHASLVKKVKNVRDEKADFLELNEVEYVFVTQAFKQVNVKPVMSVPVTIAETAVLGALSELPSKE